VNSEDIEVAVADHFGIRNCLIVPNASWGVGLHECDLLVVSSSGYLNEIEIKVTKADLKADQKKGHQHRSDKIKYLWFAIPSSLYYGEGVVDLIPAHAGILVVTHEGVYDSWRVDVKREATANKAATPATPAEHYDIARLGALRIWGLKKRLRKVREAMC